MGRRYRSRLGQTEGDTSAPASSGQPLPFLTPKVGNTLVAVGALGVAGAIGYYMFKGNSLTSLWSDLFPGGGGSESVTAETDPVVAATASASKAEESVAVTRKNGTTFYLPPVNVAEIKVPSNFTDEQKARYTAAYIARRRTGASAAKAARDAYSASTTSYTKSLYE